MGTLFLFLLILRDEKSSDLMHIYYTDTDIVYVQF